MVEVAAETREPDITNLPSPMAFKRAPSLGVSTWHFGGLLTYLAEGAETAASYCLIEAVLKPGDEPPPHVHSREDELFYVLNGRFDVHVGDQSFEVKEGGCVFMPRGMPHAFIIQSPRIHLLALFTPAGIEEAFRAVCVPAPVLDLPAEPVEPTSESLERSKRRLLELGVHLLAPDEISRQMPSYHRTVIAPDRRQGSEFRLRTPSSMASRTG
jgi:mannose-6-phosphate isomerase-like protein (cupin superfamily)